jgi:hypothetical protein
MRTRATWTNFLLAAAFSLGIFASGCSSSTDTKQVNHDKSNGDIVSSGSEKPTNIGGNKTGGDDINGNKAGSAGVDSVGGNKNTETSTKINLGNNNKNVTVNAPSNSGSGTQIFLADGKEIHAKDAEEVGKKFTEVSTKFATGAVKQASKYSQEQAIILQSNSLFAPIGWTIGVFWKFLPWLFALSIIGAFCK